MDNNIFREFPKVYEYCRILSQKADSMYLNVGENEKKNVKIPDDIISALTNAYEETVIPFIKSRLILAYDSFMGAVFCQFVTELNFYQKGLLDVHFSKTDITVQFNPLHSFQYDIKQLLGAVTGEVMRVLYEHQTTFSTLNSTNDSKKHNNLEEASDAAISEVLLRDIRLEQSDGQDNGYVSNVHKTSFKLPQAMQTIANVTKDCDKEAQKKQSMEYYYKMLEEFKKDNQGEGQDGQANGSGNNNNEMSTPSNGMGSPIHNWEEEIQDNDATKQLVASIVQEAYDSMSEKNRGNIAGSTLEQIKKILEKPQINWKQQLMKYIGTFPTPYKKTRMRLNRRLPDRGDLSGRLPKRLVKLVIAIDTSGSMSDKDIAYVLNEVLDITKNYKTDITVIECDMEIGRIYKIKSKKDIKPNVSGRGGTSFVPVIEYLNKNKYYKDAVMIYFTDGYGDSSIPKPRTYRNLWVVLEDEKCLSVKQPYGKVMSIKTDKKWRNW